MSKIFYNITFLKNCINPFKWFEFCPLFFYETKKFERKEQGQKVYNWSFNSVKKTNKNKLKIRYIFKDIP